MAAAKGSAPAMIEAGLLYSNRRQPGDDRKALEYFLQAANTGDRRGKSISQASVTSSEKGYQPT